MIRLSCQDLEACSRAIQALYAETSLETFPLRAMATLSGLVPVEHVTYNEIALGAHQVTSEFLPQRPEAARLLPQLAAKINTHPLAKAIYSTEPRRILDVMSAREFRETPVFREYYRLIQVTNQMIFGLGDGKNSRVAIALNRRGQGFSGRDQGVVSFLSPHLSQAYRNARANAELATDIRDIGTGLAALEHAIVFAAADGRIVWLSTLARDWLGEHFRDSLNSGLRLPPLLVQRMAAFGQARGDQRKSFFELQLKLTPEQHLRARGVMTSRERFLIVLECERASIGRSITESLGLTPREGEILFWISEAKADREIAAILGVSPRTVHKHVEHLLTKLGGSNRAAAQRLGTDLRRI